jgi:hypothetical protein
MLWLLCAIGLAAPPSYAVLAEHARDAMLDFTLELLPVPPEPPVQTTPAAEDRARDTSVDPLAVLRVWQQPCTA